MLDFTYITDRALRAISHDNTWQHLQTLSLQGCKTLQKKSINDVIQAREKLSMINLSKLAQREQLILLLKYRRDKRIKIVQDALTEKDTLLLEERSLNLSR